MAIFAYMLFGVVVGVIARIAMPASRLLSFWRSAFLGAVGGMVGGLVSFTLAPRESLSAFSPLGFVLAALLAVALSVGVTLFQQRRGTHV
jgi:uncharacterized membrane protein YeaQ/YmgE (transglycosylase-associated protein family)